MTPFLKSLTNRSCFTVRANSSISEVIEKLCQHNIGAVVVSIGDVVKRMLEKYEAEAEQMRSFINS